MATAQQVQPQTPAAGRTWLGMPWFASFALIFAGVLLTVIVIILTQQFAALEQMQSNTARINATVSNTQLISGQLAGLAGNVRPLGHLDRESGRFFAGAGHNLTRTADSLPAMRGSLSSLQTTATPAFHALSSGALQTLPAIAIGIRQLEALTALPRELDANLGAVRAELVHLSVELRAVPGGLGAIEQSLGALRYLGRVSIEAGSLPSLSGALQNLVALIRALDGKLADIDQHVASLDHHTAILGLTR